MTTSILIILITIKIIIIAIILLTYQHCSALIDLYAFECTACA